MEIQQIFTNNQQWIIEKCKTDPDYFKKLSKGQRPEILYIGCSDSRVSAEELMGVKPGEVFVHRNIANMVPNTDLNVMSVIKYAVSYLNVKHIVVCGHYYCGGIKAALKPADYGILNPWLRNIRDVYRFHKCELDMIEDEDIRYKRLVELNVREQCINVMKTPEVLKAYHAHSITIHGWVFDIKTGQLNDLKIDCDRIEKGIAELYGIV